MAILRDDDARFQNLSRKIGIFLLVAAAGIVLTLVSIGVQRELFTPKTKIFFVTDSGRDLVTGMAVKLSGFNIGKVKQLALTEEATVKVTLEINDQYMKWVRKDAKAQLLKEGVIGSSVIEIFPGSDKSAALKQNEEIAFEREMGLSQLIDELNDEIKPLLHDLRGVVKRADTLLAGLPATRERLDAVLGSAQRNFENLEKVTAHDLPAAVRGGREVVETSKKVVDSVSRTWPISNNIEQPKAGVLPQDSAGNLVPAPTK